MPNMLAVIMMPKNHFILYEFQGKKHTHPSILVFSLFYTASSHSCRNVEHKSNFVANLECHTRKYGTSQKMSSFIRTISRERPFPSTHKLKKKNGGANVTYFTIRNNFKNIHVWLRLFLDVLRVVWQMGLKVSEKPGASI
jgi:hypothetical protein